MSFLDLEINKKNYIKILCASIIFVVLIIIIYFIDLMTCKTLILDEETSLEVNPKLYAHIDILEQGKTKCEIAGYAYIEGETIETVNSSFVLKNRTTGKLYLLKTRYENNINVPEVYSKLAGIHTYFVKFGLPKGKYGIYVLYKNNDNNILADTGIIMNI